MRSIVTGVVRPRGTLATSIALVIVMTLSGCASILDRPSETSPTEVTIPAEPESLDVLVPDITVHDGDYDAWNDWPSSRTPPELLILQEFWGTSKLHVPNEQYMAEGWFAVARFEQYCIVAVGIALDDPENEDYTDLEIVSRYNNELAITIPWVHIQDVAVNLDEYRSGCSGDSDGWPLDLMMVEDGSTTAA